MTYGQKEGCMTRFSAVISEAEHRQFECLHRLERLDPKKEHGFRWRCIKCGKFMYLKNGVVIKDVAA